MQSDRDERGIAIEQVGISELRYPVMVRDRASEAQRTIATLSLSVGLPSQEKGTHMSRFLEVLERHRDHIGAHRLPALLADLKARLDAETARIEMHFPLFLMRQPPVSGARALMDCQCSLVGEADGDRLDCLFGVTVPLSSVCPCSKAISDHGAHSQRGRLRIECRTNETVWIEELIDVAEASASSPVYALLKSEDERHLTMRAHDNPVFVEDMARNAALRLKADKRVTWFRVRTENQESIHNHNAFAQVSFSWPKA